MASTYEHYFNIDPKYYAAVTADLIRQGKVNWKNFYPHETFVKLLETTYRVLSGKANRSIWVEGAYGTGKSHAALTVKSLLDASDEDVREYFDEFKLSSDLRDKYISLKQNSHILMVHRIGSSNIHTDMDLIMAVQESILAALKEKGIANQGEASMKDAFLEWMKDEGNREYFKTKLKNPKYLLDFGGMSVSDILQKLETGESEDVEHLMTQIMGVLKDNGVYGLFRDTNQMARWIESIIDKNHLSSILFIWDEFSEFFQNHSMDLTGFQTLVEISESHPFYFMIVAHESRNLFRDAKTANKTMDRFEPSVKIELPENMAFRLMAQAMKVTDDLTLRAEWTADKSDLNGDLGEVRRYIISKSASQSRLGKKTHLSEEELQDIVPLHPYAALLLKHIATVFNSNQRSMFDFIISNDMTDAKGFKWFIHNYGAQSDINLLTIDLLWDFFCGKQKMGLNDDVRGVLDSYGTLQLGKLTEDEKRVVKTILLFQAISLHITDDLLAPNKENVDMAFSGTDWNKNKAVSIANALVSKGILFNKPIAGGQVEYCVAIAGNGSDMAEYETKAEKQTTTSNLITVGELQKAIVIPPSVKMRFLCDSGTGTENFRAVCNRLHAKAGLHRYKVLTTFAMDDAEQERLEGQIHEWLSHMDDNWVVIQSLAPMGMDLRNQYKDNLKFAFYHAQKDRAQASHYEKQAIGVANTWKNKVGSGAFMVYTTSNSNGERMANLDELQRFLVDLDRKTYFYGVEQFALNDIMYTSYSLGIGALCGVQEKLSSAYRISNKSKSFENALQGIWQVPEYWKKAELQSHPVVQIKKKVDELIATGFKSRAGRVSMKTIWQALCEAPFGFMSTSVCALVLGFVMKEYANAKYFWSNGSTTTPMSPEKMKEMVADVMNPGGLKKGMKEQYLVSMTPEVRCFLAKTAQIFHIPEADCTSVENARNQIRVQMRRFYFPLWTVKSIVDKESLKSSAALVSQLIDMYSGIANDANYGNESSSTLAEKIGRQLLEHPALVEDMPSLCQSEKTKQGMAAYLNSFDDGALIQLAADIRDGGQYMDRVKNGFSAGEANWVWNKETVDQVISDVILEYKIVKESRVCVGSFSSYEEVLRAWQNKVAHIKIPCEIAKNQVGPLGHFLEQLLLLKRSRMIQNKDKRTFYTLLCEEAENFNAFYHDQLKYFKDAIASFADGLSDEQINDFFLKMPDDQFGRDSTPYYQNIQDGIAKVHQNEVRRKLQQLWQEKTGTKDAKEWSRIHLTPLLCLLDDGEREQAKQFLPLIGQSYGDELLVKKAISYLEHANFFDKLEDDFYIDQCFMQRVVGENRILLKDARKIRNQLFDIDSEVYDWGNSQAVRDKLKQMRNQEYLVSGKAKAEQVFRNMSADQLREYLKDKLMDPEFGMQILKGQK